MFETISEKIRHAIVDGESFKFLNVLVAVRRTIVESSNKISQLFRHPEQAGYTIINIDKKRAVPGDPPKDYDVTAKTVSSVANKLPASSIESSAVRESINSQRKYFLSTCAHVWNGRRREGLQI